MIYTNDAIKKRKDKTTKVRNKIVILVYIILVPILLYNFYLIAQQILAPGKTPSFFGYKTYVIVSGSMQPEIQIGDLVIVKEASDNELQVGDIISYKDGQSIITHRISEKIEEMGRVEYRTKGDNNNTDDGKMIKTNLIEGKVIKVIPYLGTIALALQKKVAIVVGGIIIYLYIAHSINTKGKKKERRKKRIEYENEKLKAI